MRVASCLVLEHCGSRSPIPSYRQCCEVLLGGFRVCDSEQVQQGGPSELRLVHFSYCYLRECIEIKLRGAARESGSVVDAFTSEYSVCSSGKSSS
jgi:hypothetical protein